MYVEITAMQAKQKKGSRWHKILAIIFLKSLDKSTSLNTILN